MREMGSIMRHGLKAGTALLFVGIDRVLAQTAAATALPSDPANAGRAFYAAAISTGIAALAAGIAVAYVGVAAVGALSEKPELTGRTLIFVGLAEGIAIYGLITSIMILGRVK